MTKRVPRYSPEVRARAVRMVLGHQGEHASQWAAIHSIAEKIGCSGETLRHWVRQAERDQGFRPGPTTEERPPKPRRATMTKSLLRPWPPDSDEIASDKPGLVQSTQDDDQRQIEFGIWSP